MSLSFKYFVIGMPKVELHVHLEGTLEPEMLFQLSLKNGITLPYKDPESLRAAYQFDNLQSFLKIYYQGTACLRTEEDFFELTLAYLRRCKEENIVHTEMFFDPQTHIDHGVPMQHMLHGITAARQQAERDWQISSALILCLERDRPAEGTVALIEKALQIGGIIGIGLDSAESGNPPSKFQEAFTAAKALGLYRVAHAGEEGPPAYIEEAIDILNVQRIDHGVRALESFRVMQRLRDLEMPLTVCPLSNVALGVFRSLVHHNLKELLDAGLQVTINSDDPAYFGGYLCANIEQSWLALQMSKTQLLEVQHNAIRASFVDSAFKQKLHEQLENYFIHS